MTPEEPDYASITTQDTSGERIIVTEAPVVDVSTMFLPPVPQVGEGQEILAQTLADKVRRDQNYNRIFLPPQQWHVRRITANPPAPGLVLKDTPGTLHSLLIVNTGTTWVVTLSDDTLAGTNIIARYLTAVGVGLLWLDYEFNQALTITASGTPGELYVAWI